MKRHSNMLALAAMMAAMEQQQPTVSEKIAGWKAAQIEQRRRKAEDREARRRASKNLDNSPDRAKGMKPFEIDGQTIYAGTLKAAIKKARLIAKCTY